MVGQRTTLSVGDFLNTDFSVLCLFPSQVCRLLRDTISVGHGSTSHRFVAAMRALTRG